jgi:hypothetical protein
MGNENKIIQLPRAEDTTNLYETIKKIMLLTIKAKEIYINKVTIKGKNVTRINVYDE